MHNDATCWGTLKGPCQPNLPALLFDIIDIAVILIIDVEQPVAECGANRLVPLITDISAYFVEMIRAHTKAA